jgi:hypothetical protein
VRYGIPRRMRAQHQTQMTVHVRKLNRGMNNQSINNQSIKQAKQQKPVPGAEFQKEFKKFQFKFKFKFKFKLKLKFKLKFKLKLKFK